MLTGEYEWPKLIGSLTACAVTLYMANCSKLLAAILAVAQNVTVVLELCVFYGGGTATFCRRCASVCQIA